jgi:glycerate 2-kinase
MTTREKAIQIFNAGVAAVQPSQLIPLQLFIEEEWLHIFNQRFLLNELPGIYVIGAGKASAAMAKTVEGILGDLINAGIVVTKYEHSIPLQKIICTEAAHPVPDEQGISATAATIQLLLEAKANDLIICLISGGASTLWIDVPAGVSLEDIQETFQLLLNCGATIDEVNTIRKHLSAIKGGQLLQYAPQANWFSLIISDVPGDDLHVIASGPTVPDNTSFSDVQRILEKYHLLDLLPTAILKHINNGIKGIVKETPGETNPVFKQVHNRIIGSNGIAMAAAAVKAKQLGFHIPLTEYNLCGDAANVGRELMQSAEKYTGVKPACFLLGGETTVTVTGKGKGGRNQHLVLSALMELASQQGKTTNNEIAFLSAGTDGTDGPTDAAGAIADKQTLSIAQEKQLDLEKYFNNNDAYHFFEQAGGLIKTGATQTNVMDLVVVIIDN